MDQKAGFWQAFLLVVLLSFVVQVIHEAGHWAVYEVSGRSPVWGFSSLVQLWGERPLHPDEWVQFTTPDGETGWLRLTSLPDSDAEQIAMFAGGPLATLLAVLTGLAFRHFARNAITRQLGLSLSLVGSFVASLYYLSALFKSGGGDEYYLAFYLGISETLIEILFGLAVWAAFAVGLRTLVDWRSRTKWIGALLLGSPLVGLVVMQGNQIVQEQVNEANPLFQPILGFPLPVAIVNGLVLIIVIVWWYRARQRSEGGSSLIQTPVET